MTITARELIERETELGKLRQEVAQTWQTYQSAQRALDGLKQAHDDARWREEEFANELREIRSQVMAESEGVSRG